MKPAFQRIQFQIKNILSGEILPKEHLELYDL